MLNRCRVGVARLKPDIPRTRPARPIEIHRGIRDIRRRQDEASSRPHLAGRRGDTRFHGRAHAELLAVIDRSIDALESASEGLRQYEQDYWGYMTYKDTPGWKTFSSRSDRISGE